MSTAKRLARYEDLFDLPDNVVGEIIAGRLLASPRRHRNMLWQVPFWVWT